MILTRTKPYLLSGLLSLLGLLACQPDDPELSASLILAEDLPLSESVIMGERTRYAGYGYELVEGERYNSPFTNLSVLPSTLVDVALEADFEVITSTSVLDAFVSRGRTYGISVELAEKYQETLEQFGVGPRAEASAKRKITDRIVVADSVVTAVARITVRRLRYDVNAPRLTSQAQELLDQGEIDEFFGDYGTTYVSSRTVGGEVYYVYNFDFSKTNEIRKSERESMVRALVGEMFDTQLIGQSSGQSDNPVGRFSVGGGSVSNINGFVGGIVKTVDEFNHEITRIQDYLTEKPQYANTVDMSLTSYTSLMSDNEELQAGFERQLTCFAEYYEWQQLADDLNYIKKASSIGALREAAEDQLDGVLRNLGSMYLCRGASGDIGAYRWITDWWKLEEATVPLYRFYSEERRNHYYTTDPETIWNVDGADSYSIENPDRSGGVECRVFREEQAGTTWIKEFWNNPSDDHRYNTQLLDRGDGDGYGYRGVVGYIYDNNDNVDSRRIRPLYSYYHPEKRDHLMTADPAEQFGLPADLEEYPPRQADGYQLLGTLGYAVSHQ